MRHLRRDVETIPRTAHVNLRKYRHLWIYQKHALKTKRKTVLPPNLPRTVYLELEETNVLRQNTQTRGPLRMEAVRTL